MVVAVTPSHLVFPGRQTVAINDEEGWAKLRVRPRRETPWTPSVLVLDAALDAGGQHISRQADAAAATLSC